MRNLLQKAVQLSTLMTKSEKTKEAEETVYEPFSPPSMLNDPFQHECIASVSLHYYRGHSVSFFAKVRFANGNTKGEQEFEGESFEDLLEQVEKFVKSL